MFVNSLDLYKCSKQAQGLKQDDINTGDSSANMLLAFSNGDIYEIVIMTKFQKLLQEAQSGQISSMVLQFKEQSGLSQKILSLENFEFIKTIKIFASFK